MKKVVMLLIIYFVSSCNTFNENSTAVIQQNIKKHDEILMIMRQDQIKDFENSGFLKFIYSRRLKKMKEDYYYEIKNRDSLLIAIPGPNWKLIGPLEVSNEEYKLIEGYYEGDENYFKNEYRDGDELYFFMSDDLSWAYLRGRKGYVLIRDNKVANWFITTIN